jgi:hypothetical protein
MNLDLLDESYPMVKSKLPFEDFDQGGLTGYAILVRPTYRDMPILCVNICPPVLWQSLRARKHSQWSKLAKDDDSDHIAFVTVLKAYMNVIVAEIKFKK